MTTVSALDLPAPMQRLWLVGCGAMGGALLARWRACGLADASVTVVDPAPRGLPPGFAGAVVPDAGAAAGIAPAPTMLVLGVKPQLLPEVGPVLAAAAGSTLLLSMLAGVRLRTLGALFPRARLARMMPNTPARIGRGVTALFAPGLADEDRAACGWVADAAGVSVWLDAEEQFDAVTALSGSGPAYLFRFLEALSAAGEAAGLPAGASARLALETVAGAAELARGAARSPAELRAEVTSPNGTTAAGLAVLDGEGELSALLRRTVEAAAERSRALAADAEAGAGKGRTDG
jgi:pyrroline-5-carboxylate reductase